MTKKKCSVCGKRKSLDAFYPSKRRRDGRNRECKACTYAKIRAWQRANPDKVRAQNKRQNAKLTAARRAVAATRQPKPPPSVAELQARHSRRLQFQREYYRAHREQSREKRRLYRQEHRDELRAYSRQYYQKHHAHLLKLKAIYREKRRAQRNKLASRKNRRG